MRDEVTFFFSCGNLLAQISNALLSSSCINAAFSVDCSAFQ